MPAKKKLPAKKKRTTHRTPTGTKVYAKRTKTGQFEDIQTFKKAHGQDVRRVSQAETAQRKKAGLAPRAKKK